MSHNSVRFMRHGAYIYLIRDRAWANGVPVIFNPCRFTATIIKLVVSVCGYSKNRYIVVAMLSYRSDPVICCTRTLATTNDVTG